MSHQGAGDAPGGAADALGRYVALSWLHQPVWVFDIDHARVHWANDSALALWRAASLAELCGRDMGADMSPSVARRLRQYQQDFERGPVRFDEQWTLYPQGEPRTMKVVFSGHRLADGRMAMLCEAVEPGRADPDSLRSVEALLHTSVMITLYSPDWQPLYRNPAAREALPRTEAGHALVNDDDARALAAQLAAQGHARLIAPVQTREGERWHELSARRCHDAVGGAEAVLVSEVDVTELKRTEARANFLAQHDTLTGLPNRHFVLHRFHDAIERLHQRGEPAALIFIDLDHFKLVNDTLGHAAGDELLVQTARRLRKVIREDDLVARLGGDEFLVLASLEAVEPELSALTQRIVRTVSQPVLLQGTEVRVTPSLGVSLFPRDGADVDSLMRHADLAMYRAKDNGRNGVAHFTPELTEAMQSRLTLESEMRQGLERGEFDVYYQPRVSARERRVVGVEALARWQHPTRGLVLPDRFIRLSEESGQILALGEHVFEQAARQQAAWAANGKDWRVSVNLSSRQFAEPALIDHVQALVERTGCNPQCMELEITESMLMGNEARTVQSLERLVGMGFRIAIDDFGTGYSNLAYLQRYPIHTLKIDRSFVQNIGSSAPLAELIVTLGRALQLHIVAEGVETDTQWAWLAERGVTECQGFLFGAPLPLAHFEAMHSPQAGTALS